MARTPPSFDGTYVFLGQSGSVNLVPADKNNSPWGVYRLSGSTTTSLVSSIPVEAGYSVQVLARTGSNIKDVLVVSTGSGLSAITSSFYAVDLSGSPTDSIVLYSEGLVPSDIPGMYAWFRSDDLAVQSAGTLQTWSDRSGQGHMTPFRFFSGGGSATVITGSDFGGYPYIRLAEVEFTSSYTNFPQAGTTSSMTTFSCLRYSGGNFSAPSRAWQGLGFGYFPQNSTVNNARLGGSDIIDFVDTRNYAHIVGGQFNYANPFSIYAYGIDGWHNGLHINGDRGGTATAITVNGTLTIGDWDVLVGTLTVDLVELIIYEGIVTGSYMDAVHRYLANRYNVVLTGVL